MKIFKTDNTEVKQQQQQQQIQATFMLICYKT